MLRRLYAEFTPEELLLVELIPQVKGDWLKVGNLLGVQTETAQFWGAGVVRRITRDEYQQRRVGIPFFRFHQS